MGFMPSPWAYTVVLHLVCSGQNASGPRLLSNCWNISCGMSFILQKDA